MLRNASHTETNKRAGSNGGWEEEKSAANVEFAARFPRVGATFTHNCKCRAEFSFPKSNHTGIHFLFLGMGT